MTAGGNPNMSTFPVAVIFETNGDEAELSQLKNVWSGYGTRSYRDLKEAIGRSYYSLSEIMGYYKHSPDSHKLSYAFVEFINEHDAYETFVSASLIQQQMIAIRFMDVDREKINAIGCALQKYLDARANLYVFDEEIGSYDYYAQQAGISNSNFSNWNAEASDIRKLLSAEEALIEAHINSLLDSLRLKA